MTVKEIIESARREVGVTEYPPNSNCVKYNDWFYNKKGIQGAAYPWCCAFISWLFRGTTLVKRTASCTDMLNWFKAKGQIVTKPQRGDLVFFKWGKGSKPTDHIGIVVAVVNGNTITTIEGNTSVTSQQNGGAVMERTRRSNIVAYARPKYDGQTVDATPTKDLTAIALEVKAGKWGVGNDRRQRLTAAGYDYKAVQAIVNEMLRGGK